MLTNPAMETRHGEHSYSLRLLTMIAASDLWWWLWRFQIYPSGGFGLLCPDASSGRQDPRQWGQYCLWCQRYSHPAVVTLVHTEKQDTKKGMIRTLNEHVLMTGRHTYTHTNTQTHRHKTDVHTKVHPATATVAYTKTQHMRMALLPQQCTITSPGAI